MLAPIEYSTVMGVGYDHGDYMIRTVIYGKIYTELVCDWTPSSCSNLGERDASNSMFYSWSAILYVGLRHADTLLSRRVDNFLA